MSPESRAESNSRFYHPELDGLRFFAFLAVFLHHAWEIASIHSPLARSLWWAGTAGVDVFFVLSGYLITELLRRETAQFGEVRLSLFYARRCLRIWPLYFTLLAVAWVGDGLCFSMRGFSPAEVVLFATFLGNWSCVWFAFPQSVASALWTVSIEEQFYLFWPVLVRRFTPGRIFVAAVGLLLVGTITRAVGIARGWSDLTLYTSTFTRLDGLACGALLAAGLNGSLPRLSNSIRTAMWTSGLILVVLTYRFTGSGFVGRSDWSLLVQPLAIALAAVGIVVSTLRPNGERVGLVSRPLMVRLGMISYGLYVLHRPVQRLTALFFVSYYPSLPIPIYATISLILTIAAASLSYVLIERPFLIWKARFQRASRRIPTRESASLVTERLVGAQP